MNDTQYRPSNFVVAEPEVQYPRVDLVRRNDVVDQVGRLIDVYQDQQRAALSAVQVDANRGGYLSTADQVDARRRTSRMYLAFYVIIVAMVSGGLVLLAYGAGYVGAGGAFATWLSMTGGLALWLGWRRHGDELMLTPESIAHRVIDAHENVALYEGETRRLSLQWEYRAEARRQQAAAQASADARAEARLRMEEIDARRRMQAERFDNHQTYSANGISQLSQAEPEPTPSTWQGDLLQWVSSLFTDDGMTATGVIKGRVPWAQRSEWTPADKEAARRVCCSLRPALIVQADGGRWRVKLELADNAETALRILTPRLQAD